MTDINDQAVGTDQAADLTVIGGGPGGYVAALRAAQLGAKVVLVEKDSLGGVCLNEGCIPTKTLVETASRYYELTRQQEYGITVRASKFDYAQAKSRQKKVVETLVRGVYQLLRGAKVRVLRGKGSFLDRQTLRVELNNGGVELLKARKMIIASGSQAASLPVPGLEKPGDGILFSRQALELDHVPKSMLVIGAGPVGLEFAQSFSRLGAEVTLIEALPSIAPTEDPDISRLLDRLLRRENISIMTGSRVIKVDELNRKLKRVTVMGENGKEEIDTEAVLVAVGRQPHTQDLGLDTIGIKTAQPEMPLPEGYHGAPGMRVARGSIPVNEYMETIVPGIFAVGDATGGWFLAHVASHQGEVAAENALGLSAVMDYRVIPRVIYTRPEVASVGLTETQAREKGYSVEIGRFPLAANGRSLTLGESLGMIKVVAEANSGKILGTHILAPEAGELISEASLAMHLKGNLDSIAGLIHPHPTLSEAVREGVLAALGRPLHTAPRR